MAFDAYLISSFAFLESKTVYLRYRLQRSFSMAAACTYPAMNLTADHHADEVVGMIDATTSSNVALSSTQQEMPGTVRFSIHLKRDLTSLQKM